MKGKRINEILYHDRIDPVDILSRRRSDDKNLHEKRNVNSCTKTGGIDSICIY
jgi:hypothetical protein